ncbi:MAG TPA: Imm49 family immunity protein [Archangium sp.]|uniref:Imm49 family immunity protein n=1 Tax=Archangium sp. TaxID=1872627 RepID=UPI002E3299E8|nr:Imm49 family immunity protein [Archangium sp.]HEX5748290.1 Imm49 family immunity protein [Archangium sp.]
MSLEELKGSIVLYLDGLARTAAQQRQASAIGKVYYDLARHHRAFGICVLLTDVNVDGFFHGLIQSALTWKFFLERCQLEGVSDSSYRRVSLSAPFLDAVAAGQWKLAKQIAALSADAWRQGEEYEDDFAYARFLHRLLDFEQAERAVAQHLLDQFERALEGGSDVRLELARALLDKNQDAFESAFEGLLDDHEHKMKRIADPQRDSVLAREYTFEPNRHIMVEGLAILQVAEVLGLKLESEYKFCPGFVRRTQYAPFAPLTFPGAKLED